jgi:hypothetical protein
MRGSRWGWCAAGLVVVAVGLVMVGFRPSAVLFGVVVLACPLMMLFMHRGHGGGDQPSPRLPEQEPLHEPTSGSDDSTVRSL